MLTTTTRTTRLSYHANQLHLELEMMIKGHLILCPDSQVILQEYFWILICMEAFTNVY